MKNYASFVCIVLLFSVLFVNPITAQPTASAWPMFLNNARHTGRGGGSVASTVGLSWSFETGGAVMASPVIGTGGTVYVGSIDNSFYALDSDGGLDWSYRVWHWIKGPAAADANGLVYVGTSNNDYVSLPGFACAFTSGGAFRWSYDSSLGSSRYTVEDPPTIGDSGAVYWRLRYLHSFTSDGSVNWMNTSGGNAPALGSDETSYFCGAFILPSRNRVLAMDSGGNISWSYHIYWPASYLALGGYASVGAGGTVYLGSSGYYDRDNHEGELLAFDSDGTFAWSYELPEHIGAGPALNSGERAFVCGTNDNTLYAIDSNCSFAWSYTGSYHLRNPVIDADDNVIVGTTAYDPDPGNGIIETRAEIFAFSSNGSFTWSYSLPHNASPACAIGSDGRVYVGCYTNRVYALGPAVPTSAPTQTPTATPTGAPTNTPTETPTVTPTAAPTNTPGPTAEPTDTPVVAPTATGVPRAQAEVVLNGTSFGAGDALTAMFQLNESIGRPFTVFAAFVLPNGGMLDAATLSSTIKPLASSVPGLDAPFSYPLVSTTVTTGAPRGDYDLFVAFFDPSKPITGRGDAFLEAISQFRVE